MPDEEKEPKPNANEPDPKPDSDTDPGPDWKSEADKWKALARKHEDTAKKNADAAAKLRDMEDSQKTELQKLTEGREATDRELSAARLELVRLRVALRKNLTESQAKRLIGDTEEALEADADELLATFQAKDDKDDRDVQRRPRELLRPGAIPSKEPEVDTSAIVDKMMAANSI